jgi:hypothetical protein
MEPYFEAAMMSLITEDGALYIKRHYIGVANIYPKIAKKYDDIPCNFASNSNSNSPETVGRE